MKITVSLYLYVKEWIRFILGFLGSFFMLTTKQRFEIAALRTQLALVMHQIESGKRPKPKPTLAFRQQWVLISKCCTAWRSFMALFTTETVLKWHDTAFKNFWAQILKKNKPGVSL